MIIQISVTDKRAVPVGDPVIVCGNSDYKIEFLFDSAWDDLAVKTARFVYLHDGEVRYQDAVFEGTTVAVPVLSGIKGVRVGVFAGDLSTTSPAWVPCELSIRCETGAPEDPTPSQYDQIMALLSGKSGIDVTGAVPGQTVKVVEVDAEGRPTKWEPANFPAGGGTVCIDPTLTKPGEAADAAAVGRAMAEKVGTSELNAAVGNALTTAKESGKFDGPPGEPGTTPHIGANGNWWIGTTNTGVKAQGDDYVLTDADKTEIAEEAAELVDVDVPEKLPNPNALTFTGAVTGTYDGSAPLNVVIPSGGGGTGGASVELDSTLTEPGKAADAKAVGDAIAKKLDADKLPAAVETALAEAKESGEFDGPQGNPGTTPHIGANGNWWIGTTDTGVKAQGEPGQPGDPGDDYVLTDSDKTAIAEEAAGMVDVPEKLPNPNALTFSGAVTGTYDGSEPLNVVIPSGGGGTGGASVELDSTLTEQGKAADAKAVGDALSRKSDKATVPNSATVNADNELVMQHTEGDAVAELFKVALPAGGGGGGAEVTMYQNVTSMPLTNGAQYIFYASEAGTITVTFPDEKWGAFNSTISLNAAGICKWYIWVQTGDTAGSFISVDGTRNYKEFKSTVPEAVSLSSTCSNFIVLKLG